MKYYKNILIAAIMTIFSLSLFAGDPPSTGNKNARSVISKGTCSGKLIYIRPDHIRFKSESGNDYRLFMSPDIYNGVPIFNPSLLSGLAEGDSVTVDWAVSSKIFVTAIKKDRPIQPGSFGNSKFDEDKRKKQSEITDLFSRGVGYFNNDNFEEAIKVFQAVMVLDPKHTGSSEYLDKTKEKISQKTAWQHFYKGNELAASGKIVEAVAEWQLSVSSSPDNKALSDAVSLSKQKILNEHNDKGSSFLKESKVVEAIAEFNAALSVDPSNQAAKKGMEIANSKFKSLREEEKTGLEYESYYGRAMSAIDKKDYIAALDFYEKAARVRPSKEITSGIKTLKEQILNMSLTATGNAEKFAAEGNWVEAAKQWRLCLSIDPKSKKSLEALAKYAEELKTLRDKLYLEGLEAYGKEDTETAIAKWKDVLVLDPDYQKAQLNILKATRKQ